MVYLAPWYFFGVASSSWRNPDRQEGRSRAGSHGDLRVMSSRGSSPSLRVRSYTDGGQRTPQTRVSGSESGAELEREYHRYDHNLGLGGAFLGNDAVGSNLDLLNLGGSVSGYTTPRSRGYSTPDLQAQQEILHAVAYESNSQIARQIELEESGIPTSPRREESAAEDVEAVAVADTGSNINIASRTRSSRGRRRVERYNSQSSLNRSMTNLHAQSTYSLSADSAQAAAAAATVESLTLPMASGNVVEAPVAKKVTRPPTDEEDLKLQLESAMVGSLVASLVSFPLLALKLQLQAWPTPSSSELQPWRWLLNQGQRAIMPLSSGQSIPTASAGVMDAFFVMLRRVPARGYTEECLRDSLHIGLQTAINAYLLQSLANASAQHHLQDSLLETEEEHGEQDSPFDENDNEQGLTDKNETLALQRRYSDGQPMHPMTGLVRFVISRSLASVLSLPVTSVAVIAAVAANPRHPGWNRRMAGDPSVAVTAVQHGLLTPNNAIGPYWGIVWSFLPTLWQVLRARILPHTHAPSEILDQSANLTKAATLVISRPLSLWKLALPAILCTLLQDGVSLLVERRVLRNLLHHGSLFPMGFLRYFQSGSNPAGDDGSEDFAENINEETVEAVSTITSHAAASMLAAFVGDAVAYPVNTILVKLHLQGLGVVVTGVDGSVISAVALSTPFTSFMDCAIRTVQFHGVSALYSGFSMFVAYHVTNAAVFFLVTRIGLEHRRAENQDTVPPSSISA
eukprot:Clim_evm17s215 gene=Clim_evmTU17s215